MVCAPASVLMADEADPAMSATAATNTAAPASAPSAVKQGTQGGPSKKHSKKQGKKKGKQQGKKKGNKQHAAVARVLRPTPQHVKKTITLPCKHDPPLTMHGWSRSMAGTGFYIPELKWMLDCGISNLACPTHVFVTHGHMDHSMELVGASVASWMLWRIPTQVYCPAELTGFVKSYIHSGLQMNFLAPVTTDSAHDAGCPEPYASRDLPWPVDIHGCSPAQPARPVDAMKAQLQVEVFQCDHSVPTVGYGFFRMTQRLAPEYQGLPGKEIARLRREGTKGVVVPTRVPAFAFLGDTTAAVFDTAVNPTLLDYPCVIVECSFLHPEHLADAAARKHMHWATLAPVVAANPATTFVLIHFSLRYTDGDIHAFFNNMGTDRPANIVVFVPEEEESVEAVRASARFKDPAVPAEAWQDATRPRAEVLSASADAEGRMQARAATGAGAGAGAGTAAGASAVDVA